MGQRAACGWLTGHISTAFEIGDKLARVKRDQLQSSSLHHYSYMPYMRRLFLSTVSTIIINWLPISKLPMLSFSSSYNYNGFELVLESAYYYKEL